LSNFGSWNTVTSAQLPPRPRSHTLEPYHTWSSTPYLVILRKWPSMNTMN